VVGILEVDHSSLEEGRSSRLGVDLVEENLLMCCMNREDVVEDSMPAVAVEEDILLFPLPNLTFQLFYVTLSLED